MSSKASAAGQLTERSLTISTALPSATGVTYSFSFVLQNTTQVQGLKFKACTTAVGAYPGGTCTAPTGMTGGGNGFTAATYGAQSGWTGATNFAVDLSGSGDCIAAGNILCATRTDATSQASLATPRVISFSTIKNPSTANTSFYVGVTTYSTVNWTAPSVVDFGATAAAIVQSLTVNATVAEILQFCVGSTTVDDADVTTIASDCSGISGTSISIGTLDPSQLNISPVSVDGGDSKNGVAMLRTNSTNGAVVAYRAVQASSGTNHLGSLRITGGSCNAGNVNSDPCINSQGGTQGTFTPGTEKFGMTIAGNNCKGTSSYTCTFAGSTYNLVPQTNLQPTAQLTALPGMSLVPPCQSPARQVVLLSRLTTKP
ncbi:hypothetical protein KW803_01895 [Candidatus Saccharibacteria bacterium]|nr:hypothetical protein [Candidatus Saccharibacteria bacterium]